MVEFAIVLPVFLMLVLGAIDWGWFFVVRDAAANAAREGARAGVVLEDSEARARSILSGMLPAAQAARCGAVKTEPPNAVRVDVTCPVGSLSGVTAIGAFSWVAPPPVTVRAEMRR